ncbi:hypothetical protein HMPREF9541_05043 [Escherichia coli MS 116-1]|nr:hypothetical protein HMPREF9541_05043 [Escherichia coli MS 116-1]
MLVVHAGCGVNALSGLQSFANSIYCNLRVGLISVAHQNFSFMIIKASFGKPFYVIAPSNLS